MPDKDLRKQALKSGKTTSKKSQRQSTESSRPTSRPSSAPNSRPSSRIASRNASDDEGEISDDTNYSINSIDALLESDDFNELTTDSLKQELTDCIEELLERKGSNSKSREDSLIHYDRILASHQLGDVLYGRIDGLVAAFSKSIKADTTPKETTFALKAIALTAISYESATLYDTVSSLLKRTITDTQDFSTKAAAIHALSICISYGGAGESEINEQLTFLLEIVQSDGAFAGADDNAEVVAAAIQAYAYLATYVDDLENESEDAIEAFLEQLDSGSAHVQIAAGEAIALLFEKSYTPREDDEDEEEDDHEASSSDAEDRDMGDTSLVKRYNAYHNPAQVLEKVLGLAGLSSKGMSRHDKKKLHQSFSSVAITVENPRLGLRTNSASRMVVRIHGESEIKVDQWWKLMRLNTLRRLLGGGFINHYYEGNKQILDSLPVIVRSTQGGSGALSPRRTPRRPGDKYRDVRRFVAAEAI